MAQLSLRKRKRRRKAQHTRLKINTPSRTNERWAMDFVHDSLWNGRKYRVLTIIDMFTRESLRLEADTSIGGKRVARVLNERKETRGLPQTITVDNGPEFAGKVLDRWAYTQSTGKNINKKTRSSLVIHGSIDGVSTMQTIDERNNIGSKLKRIKKIDKVS